jgi:hypothetical protein
MWPLILIKTLASIFRLSCHDLDKCIYSCMSITLVCLAFMTIGCTDTPKCVPGRTVACPCVPGGHGIQRCAEDGSRFLECECAHSDPPLQSLSGPQAHLNTVKRHSKSSRKGSSTQERNPIFEQSLPSSFAQPKYAVAASLNKNRKEKNKATTMVALEAKIEDVSASKKSSKLPVSATKMFKLNIRNQQEKWWFYSETLERCVHAENVNGIDYAPLKLLSEGCYRLGHTDEMTVRCDDPPLGPQTYRFSDKERDCIAKRSAGLEHLNAQSKLEKAEKKSKISVLEPVIEGQRQKKRGNRNGYSKQRKSGDIRKWHCMCYKEIVKGTPTLSTACRPTRAMCHDLMDKVKVGSPILVKGSLSASCQERRGLAPWNAFKGTGSRRYYWQPSSHPGAWWSAEGCFLTGSRSSSRATRSSSSSRKDKTKTNNKEAEVIPSEVLRPIGTSRSLIKYGQKGSAPRLERCEETCRANLSSDQERRELYGVSTVPPLLRWGKSFAERVKLVKTICMSNQGKAKRGREICLRKVISKCSKYCERTED